MTYSPHISDDLLSAYIDHEISEAELRRVEKALAVSPSLQQQLKSLQATVALFQNAPRLAVPRAFVLSENQALAAGGRVKGLKRPSFWEQWLPRLMPAVTAVIAVLFIFSFTFMPVVEKAPAAAPSSAEARKAVSVSPEAATAPAVQSLAVEPPAPMAAQPRAKTSGEAPVAIQEVTEANGNADTSVNETSAASAPASDNGSSASPASSPLTQRFSPLSWLLGALLLALLILTWRISIVRPRRQ